MLTTTEVETTMSAKGPVGWLLAIVVIAGGLFFLSRLSPDSGPSPSEYCAQRFGAKAVRLPQMKIEGCSPGKHFLELRELDALVLIEGARLYLVDRRKDATVRVAYREQHAAMAPSSAIAGHAAEVEFRDGSGILSIARSGEDAWLTVFTGGGDYRIQVKRDDTGLQLSEPVEQPRAVARPRPGSSVPLFCYDFDYAVDIPTLASRAIVRHDNLYLADLNAPVVIPHTLWAKGSKQCGRVVCWSNNIEGASKPLKLRQQYGSIEQIWQGPDGWFLAAGSADNYVLQILREGDGWKFSKPSSTGTTCHEP
jgi:hypothetical protein